GPGHRIPGLVLSPRATHVSPTTIESSFWQQVIDTTRCLRVIPTCCGFGRGRPWKFTVSHHENTLRSGPTMTTTGAKTDSEDKMVSPRRVLVASSTLSNLGDGVQLAAMPLRSEERRVGKERE